MALESIEQVKEQLEDAETVFERFARRKADIRKVGDRMLILRIFDLLAPRAGYTREAKRDFVYELIDNANEVLQTHLGRASNLHKIEERVLLLAIVSQLSQRAKW